MSVTYRGSKLYLGENGSLLDIIQGNEGLACYVYDLKDVEHRYNELKKALGGLKNLKVHYALKANGNSQVLNRLKHLGAGADVVSRGEMQLALDHGFPATEIIFSGVAKSVGEINSAIDAGIKQINVESPQELRRIGELAKAKGRKMPVALRMNPEVNPVTHPYITTGMSENKFGMDRSFIPELVRILNEFSDSLYLRGLTMHIGSQILELDAMKEAIQKMRSIYHELEVLGHPMESLDIGGGVGIHYDTLDTSKDFKTLATYGKMVEEGLSDFDGEILIEPGRILVGRCGVLLCQVEYIKETPYKTFAIVNTGMHHLMRPALYQATHQILPVVQNPEREKKVYDIVGPICESTDYLGKNRAMTEVKQGEYLAICDAGAYGFSMANNYNHHPFPKEIILD